MMRFIQVECRTQSILLPEALDEHITETNPVRVIDENVDALDLGTLGFEGVQPAATVRLRSITQFGPPIIMSARPALLKQTGHWRLF